MLFAGLFHPDPLFFHLAPELFLNLLLLLRKPAPFFVKPAFRLENDLFQPLLLRVPALLGGLLFLPVELLDPLPFLFGTDGHLLLDFLPFRFQTLARFLFDQFELLLFDPAFRLRGFSFLPLHYFELLPFHLEAVEHLLFNPLSLRLQLSDRLRFEAAALFFEASPCLFLDTLPVFLLQPLPLLILPFLPCVLLPPRHFCMLCR